MTPDLATPLQHRLLPNDLCVEARCKVSRRQPYLYHHVLGTTASPEEGAWCSLSAPPGAAVTEVAFTLRVKGEDTALRCFISLALVDTILQS